MRGQERFPVWDITNCNQSFDRILIVRKHLEMAVPFGFSAGDFIAGIGLLHKVAVALRETGGASSDFTLALSEVEGYHSLLLSVQQRIQDLNIQRSSNRNLEDLMKITHICRMHLASFFRRLESLEQDLLPNAQRRRPSVRLGVAKLKWGLQLTKDFDDLRSAITPQLAAIKILLQLVIVYGIPC
jgi:hypothetical protein